MVASFFNPELSEEISSEIDKFYSRLESKHWGNFPQDAVPQKLAIQDLFIELSQLKE